MFATRSPHRPNPIGLACAKIEGALRCLPLPCPPPAAACFCFARAFLCQQRKRVGQRRRCADLGWHLPHPRLPTRDYPGVDEDGIRVSGVALLDGTPVLDVKPFVPFSDMRADAHAPGW